jgi:hypothetical protein
MFQGGNNFRRFEGGRTRSAETLGELKGFGDALLAGAAKVSATHRMDKV